MGREKVIHMIKTQSKNKEIRQISVEARDEVYYKARRKVWSEVWVEAWRKLFL